MRNGHRIRFYFVIYQAEASLKILRAKKNPILICFIICLQERRDGGRRLGDHECDGRRSR